MIKLRFLNYLKIGCLTLILLLIPKLSLSLDSNIINNISLTQEVISNNNLTEQLNQGKLYYQNGQYHSAVEIWEETAHNFQAQGDILNYSLTLRYLASAYDELGELDRAYQLINISLNQLENITDDHNSNIKNQILAQVLTEKGKLELSQDQGEKALQTYQKAEEVYTILAHKTGILGSKINQAQVYQNLGMYFNSQKILKLIKDDLQKETDPNLKIIGLKNLGNTFYLLGNFTEAETIFNQILDLSNVNSRDQSGIYLTLANIYQEKSNVVEIDQKQAYINQALTNYQNAITTPNEPILKLKAQLNLLKFVSDEPEFLGLNINDLILTIENEINQLTLSRFAVESKINLAQQLIKIKPNNYQLKTSEILTTAIQETQILKDEAYQAYAMGILGQLYEENRQIEEALQLTENALKIAQKINTPYITALLQIQLAEFYQKIDHKNQAISTYETAIKTLQRLRKDLVSNNPNNQFSFREQIEPVYRQLIELLLENPHQENLKQARQLIEDLQLAELDNFFRDACLNKKAIENIDPQAAVFYPIILPNKLAVIVSIPNQPLEFYQSSLKSQEIEQKFINLRSKINPFTSNQELLKISQEIYQLMIAPIETKLQENKIKTLAFVLDGVMRNVPMSVLHDGQQYLIEKYSIALTPGLQLLEPKSLDKEQLRLLLGALSKATLTFDDLPNVEREVAEISQENPSELLLNETFTQDNLQTLINQLPYPIIHLATHGEFSSNLEQTFIVSWNKKIGVTDLEILIKGRDFNQSNPIEILVLSACKTASGDQKAALGLAGIAVRSGARSTVASLWSVTDNSTAELMIEFYKNLNNPNLNKAEALRQAQLTLLRQPQYQKPYYWASFVLIGNWL
jgi:CHAT domain-containing protein